MKRVFVDARSLDDYALQTMPVDGFKAKFFAALKGEENEFSPFLWFKCTRQRGKEWEELRRRVFARDGYACRYCGADGRPLECDHIIPLSRGGSDDEENLLTACAPCNRSKGAKPLEFWLGSIE